MGGVTPPLHSEVLNMGKIIKKYGVLLRSRNEISGAFGGSDLRWMRGATSDDSGDYLSEEQRSRRLKMSLPQGADRFWATTASLVTYIAVLCRVPRSLFRHKFGQPDAPFISLWFLTLIFAFAACAQPSRLAVKSSLEPVEVSGFADFNEKDLSVSKNAAISDALKNAVEEAAGLFSGEPSEIAALGKTPHSYIRKYKLLSAAREGGLYRARVRAYVELSKITAGLRGQTQETASQAVSKAALEVLESGPGAGDNFAAAFKKNLAGSQVVFEDYPWLKAAPAAQGKTLAELLSSSRDSGAELMFYVRAEARPVGAGLATGFYPVNCEAKLEVYDAASGRRLFQDSSQANALDASESASGVKALYSAGELMAQRAALNLARMARKSFELKLRVRKLGKISNLKILKGSVDKLGAKSLRLESYSDGEALFTISPLSPDPQELASALLRQDELGLELESATQTEVVFSANK